MLGIDEVCYLLVSRDVASLLLQLMNTLLDRLVHHSKVISITGKSYKMKDYSENKTKTQKSK